MARKALINPQDRLHVVPPAHPAATEMPAPASADDNGLADSATPPMHPATIQGLLDIHRLDDAANLALAALDGRAAGGEAWAAAVAAVLRAYRAEVAAFPPMGRTPFRAIRPDERAAQAFGQICSLLALQNDQLDELKATIAELM